MPAGPSLPQPTVVPACVQGLLASPTQKTTGGEGRAVSWSALGPGILLQPGHGWHQVWGPIRKGEGREDPLRGVHEECYVHKGTPGVHVHPGSLQAALQGPHPSQQPTL